MTALAASAKDSAILDFLIEESGGVGKFAEALDVSRQSVWEWRRGLTDTARIRLFLYAEENGVKLPKDFLRRAIA